MKTKILWIATWEEEFLGGWEVQWNIFNTRQEAREFKNDGRLNKVLYYDDRNWKLHKVVLNLEKEIKNPAKRRLKEAIKSQKMCRDLNKIVKKIESESKKRLSAWIKSENKRCKQNKFTNNKCDCAQCRDVH